MPQGRDHEKALPVGSGEIPVSSRCGVETPQEERPRDAGLKTSGVCPDFDGHQLLIRSAVVELFSACAPARLNPTGGRDLPPASRSREAFYVDLEASRLVRLIREEPAVG